MYPARRSIRMHRPPNGILNDGQGLVQMRGGRQGLHVFHQLVVGLALLMVRGKLSTQHPENRHLLGSVHGIEHVRGDAVNFGTNQLLQKSASLRVHVLATYRFIVIVWLRDPRLGFKGVPRNFLRQSTLHLHTRTLRCPPPHLLQHSCLALIFSGLHSRLIIAHQLAQGAPKLHHGVLDGLRGVRAPPHSLAIVFMDGITLAAG
mmetsp:Transcript_13212/g.32967  ORF Transcript_13212/g.32967 Transcript_13212/m.32967 type:complete len:204 (-) Transcript_13212:1664-2275(-)